MDTKCRSLSFADTAQPQSEVYKGPEVCQRQEVGGWPPGLYYTILATIQGLSTTRKGEEYCDM